MRQLKTYIFWSTTNQILKSLTMDVESTYKDYGSMSEQEIQELKLAFEVLDKNSDGSISASEIKNMMEEIGVEVAEEDVEEFIKRVHHSAVGGINEQEFLTWMAECREKNKDAILKDSFKAFDKNHDGFITRDELQQGLELMGEHITDDLLDSMIDEADLDRDGRINYEEFIRIMQT